MKFYGDSYEEEGIKIGYRRGGSGNIVTFHGTVSDCQNGTIINGYFKASILYYIALWLPKVIVALFIGRFMYNCYHDDFTSAGYGNALTPTAFFILIPFMLPLAFVLDWLTRAQAKEGKEIIINIIEKEMKATLQDD